MNRQRLITPGSMFAVTLLLASALLSAQPSSAATPGVYMALGDSIAAGIGSSLPRERGNAAIVREWLTRLSGESVPIENLAIPGETAETFVNGGQLQRFHDAIARSNEAGIPIAAVVVSLGGNELLSLEQTSLDDRQSGLDQFRQTFEAAISAVRSSIGPDVPLVLTNTYDLTEGDPGIRSTESWWIAQFNLAINDVADQHNALVADIAGRFDGRIDELTHYPFDVHPNNAGQRVIAQTIWSSLEFDSEVPTIDVTSKIVATHATPTITFTVADNVRVATVSASSEDVSFHGPFETGEDRYAILLDLGDLVMSEVALTLEISDDSGNVTQAVVTIEIA